MRPRTILAAASGAATVLAAFTVPAAAAARAQAQAPGPKLGLIAVQQTVTVAKPNNQPVLIDPDMWVRSYGSAFQLDVQRASYTRPVTVTQIISTPRGPIRRPLPSSVLDGWNGLKDFLHFTITNASGKVVVSQQLTFCPDSSNPERADPASPATDPYPEQCAPLDGTLNDPFPLAEVWGMASGWAADPFTPSPGTLPPGYNLALGTYRATMTITPRYRGLFGVSASAATVSARVDVVSSASCRRTGCGTAPRRAGTALPSLPRVRTMANPPRAALPQLTALPSWGISTSSQSGHDWLNFGATIWVGGNAPLDVEGFAIPGSSLLAAYQYFWLNGKVIGRARVGTMGFDNMAGHNHWHFEQFARYRLLNASKKLAVGDEKVGFCIAPTEPIDLVLPHATWKPASVGLAGQCGVPGALWVQEYLPVGWGDTYDQSDAGQSFDITNVPNGVYYIEVHANELHALHELSTAGNISLRKVILGGTKGHRTVRVPAWNGIDPEG